MERLCAVAYLFAGGTALWLAGTLRRAFGPTARVVDKPQQAIATGCTATPSARYSRPSDGDQAAADPAQLHAGQSGRGVGDGGAARRAGQRAQRGDLALVRGVSPGQAREAEPRDEATEEEAAIDEMLDAL
jgi:hypothetical protein